jgi:hypothetical protein
VIGRRLDRMPAPGGALELTGLGRIATASPSS